MRYIQMLGTILIIYISIISLTPFKLKIKEILFMNLLSATISFIFISTGEFLAMIPIVIIPIFFLYKKNKSIITSIATTIVSLLIVIIVDYLITNISIFLFGIGVDIVRGDIKLYWQLFIIEFLIVFIISKLIDIIVNKKNKILDMNFNSKFGYMILISLILTLIIFYTNIILGSETTYNNNIIKINGILFLAYFVLLMIIMYTLIRNIAKELEFKNKQNQLENLHEYTNNLEKFYTDMRAFRHDYINILSSMIGYIQNNDMKGLEKHFNTKIVPLGEGMESNNFKIGILKNIKILEIKGIFSSKLIRAQELGINVFIDIMEPIERISIDIIDLSRCIGILLDNAIEGALKCDKPSIRIAMINKENSVLTVIINSCKEDTPPIYKIYQKEFSTKGENRGLGLNNLKEIIGNYNNVFLDTIIENCEFKQHLEIINK
ncbi:MAG: sensor histidine kinase [Solirubrobacterales bacterium]